LEEFTSTITVPATPEATWRLVEKMEKLEGERPFLLKLGIPTPYRCELEQPKLGAKRVCHFREGIISQEITEWRFPNRMGVKIVDSTLPGRHWLQFCTADYEFNAVPGGTRITRRTTISSRLYPRWYWRPLERWGVTSEHDFVFSNLLRWTTNAAQTP
jgi:hypothetical protein